jgi:hypothetical protein
MKPQQPAPKTRSPAQVALDSATREQLIAILQHDNRTAVPGIYRANNEALLSAINTYLRMGRITEKQVLDVLAPTNQ